MKWDQGYQSEDVVDRRGESGPVGGGGAAAAGLLAMLFGRFGWRGLLVGGALMLFFGRGLLFGGSSGASQSGDQQSSGAPGNAPSGRPAGNAALRSGDDPKSFVGFVLDDVQHTWAGIFAAAGKRGYQPAHLVLYTGETATRCGTGAAAQGPFYCPRDANVYIDLSFYDELRTRFGAPGNFAEAYVIAHEVGHHVQDLLGTMARVEGGGRASAVGESGTSVRLELQADCYAGVWASAAQRKKLLEPGDLEGGMRAAAAVGDDRLQRASRGTIQPERWTHGSSEERVRWFRRGFDQGSPDACDTFGAATL